MSMNEDAMFKALLKNKPQPKKTPEIPVASEVKPPASVPKPSYAKNSEDAMFNALLKNKPQQPVQKTPPRSPAQAPPTPVITPIKEEPVVEEKIIPAVIPALDLTQKTYSSESLDKLTSSVNMIYGLLKTATIMMILILVVGVAVLIKIP